MQVADLSLTATPVARFVVKGRKQRVCPLWTRTTDTLRDLLGVRLDAPPGAPVFLNKQGRTLTRHGVYALLNRIVREAARTTPSLHAKRVSPHTLRVFRARNTRHTTAVHHLLRAGVDINTVSIQVSGRYS